MVIALGMNDCLVFDGNKQLKSTNGKSWMNDEWMMNLELMKDEWMNCGCVRSKWRFEI